MNEIFKCILDSFLETFPHLFEVSVSCLFGAEEVFQVPAENFVLNVPAEVGNLVVFGPSSSCGFDVKQP